MQFHSGAKSLWLPGDPNWTGSEGTLPGIVDGGAYSLNFMYKGKLQLVMKFGGSLKYDLLGDPDGIVPVDAIASKDELTWNLQQMIGLISHLRGKSEPGWLIQALLHLLVLYLTW